MLSSLFARHDRCFCLVHQLLDLPVVHLRQTLAEGRCTLGTLVAERVMAWPREGDGSPRLGAKGKFQSRPLGRACAVLIRVLVCVAGALALLRSGGSTAISSGA